MGVISAIGNNVTENRHALIEGKSGISTLEMFPSKFVGSLPVGEIKISDNTFIKNLQVKEQGISRTTLLALHAFNEAVADSNLSGKQISSFDTAFITASTVGGMCHTDMMYNDAKIDTAGSPFISSYEYAATSLYLQKRFSLQGHVNTINTACSSSANAIMYGAKLIKSGRANRVIVGGVDSLAKFTINGFNALHILSAKPCTPFDEERTGLNLGEAAAFIVLEKEEDATHKKNYATLSGYSNANDSYHASTLSNEANGPYFAMKAALEAANLLPSQINYVNAHGTSTENNDLIESIAMLKLFENAPLFSSTKANTGHTLGAAAAVEAVYCILNLYHQELYGALRFYNPIATTKLAPIQAYTKIPLSHVMSNSFGFGGNCSSLIFSKI